MKLAVNTCGYKYCEYVTTCVDDGMVIGNNPSIIINDIESKYFLQVIKGIFGKYCLYLEASVGEYDVYNYVRLN